MIAIAHAAWAPGRVETLDRLLKQIPRALVVRSEVKEHASTWALRLWRAVYHAARPGEWCILLNDDVTIAPYEVLHAMLDAVPESADAVSLATIQPEAKAAFARGERFLKSYLATGPGYAIRREALGDLIEFHSKKLSDGMRANMNEDEVISHWAWAVQQPIWQCLPALVDHNVEIPSTCGFDNHPGRRALLLWHNAQCDLLSWSVLEEGPAYVPHPWLGEGRMRAVRAQICGDSVIDTTVCVFCADRPILILSPKTGVGICGQCLADGVGHVLSNARVA